MPARRPGLVFSQVRNERKFARRRSLRDDRVRFVSSDCFPCRLLGGPLAITKGGVVRAGECSFFILVPAEECRLSSGARAWR